VARKREGGEEKEEAEDDEEGKKSHLTIDSDKNRSRLLREGKKA
jgi:hypothetical protein